MDESSLSIGRVKPFTLQINDDQKDKHVNGLIREIFLEIFG